MKTISIGVSRPLSMKFKWFAWILMKAYGVDFSHVYLRLPNPGLERDLIYQASGEAVNFMGPAIFASVDLPVHEFDIEITDAQHKALLQFCIDNVGKPYSVKEDIGLGYVKICSWLGLTVKNPFPDHNGYICSQLGAYVLSTFCGDTIPMNLDLVTPKDVYNYLLTLKLTDKIVK